MKIRALFLLLPLFFVVKAKAQDNIIPAGHMIFHMADRYEIMSGTFVSGTQITGGFLQRKHIFPLLENDSILSNQDIFNRDSYLKRDLQYGNEKGEFAEFGNKPFYRNFYSSPAFLVDYYNPQKSYRLTINPILALGGGRDMVSPNRNLYRNTRGIEVKGFLGEGEKIGFYSMATENQVGLPDFVNFYTDSFGFLPNQGFWKRFKETGYDYFQARGHFWFNVTEFATVRFGHDKVFIGNGLRSLVIGDHAPQNLFLQINTNMGIFNYQNYFAELTDFTRLTGGDLLNKKYMAFHRIGVNITKRINVGFFEATMFDRQDPGQSNMFDLNYLNPVIFYRAIEQNLGSQDNAMVGFDFKWNFLHHFQLYGQFVLDEFKLDEIKGRTGWWANKYGTQAGLKYVNVFGVKNLDIQAEYNSARPFTYSHFRSGGSWAHYGQPLAHPLGANFREFIFRVNAQPLKRLWANVTLISFNKGEDFTLSGDNYGGNILRDYSQRAKEYDNQIGQGRKIGGLITDVNISYMIAHNLFLDARMYYKIYSKEVNLTQRYPDTEWFNLGLRWNIGAEQRLMYY